MPSKRGLQQGQCTTVRKGDRQCQVLVQGDRSNAAASQQSRGQMPAESSEPQHSAGQQLHRTYDMQQSPAAEGSSGREAQPPKSEDDWGHDFDWDAIEADARLKSSQGAQGPPASPVQNIAPSHPPFVASQFTGGDHEQTPYIIWEGRSQASAISPKIASQSWTCRSCNLKSPAAFQLCKHCGM